MSHAVKGREAKRESQVGNREFMKTHQGHHLMLETTETSSYCLVFLYLHHISCMLLFSDLWQHLIEF